MFYAAAGAVVLALVLLTTIAVNHFRFYRDWKKGEQPEATEKKAES